MAERAGAGADDQPAVEGHAAADCARMMLANVLEKEELAKTVQRDAVVLAQAAHWRRYDLDRLPDNPQLWARAAKLLMDPALRDAKVGVGPEPTICLEEALKAARKAVALDPNLPAAQEVLKQCEAAIQATEVVP